MTAMKLIPVNVSHGDLLDILDDIRERVAEGDSFEGSISWELPCDGAPVSSFDVRATYRRGNLTGQGSVRMVGQWREIPDGQPVTLDEPALEQEAKEAPDAQ